MSSLPECELVQLKLRTTGLTSHHLGEILFSSACILWTMRVMSLAEWHKGILFESAGCQLGALWGGGVVWWRTFLHWKCQHFPPASISDLVSPGIVGCLGSVIWYPSSFCEKKNLQPRLSFSIPTFSIYLLSKSPTRKQCPKNRCSDVGLETGLTSKMAPLGIFLTWRMLTLVWKLIPLTWKICLIWKKVDIAIALVVWKPFGCQG